MSWHCRGVELRRAAAENDLPAVRSELEQASGSGALDVDEPDRVRNTSAAITSLVRPHHRFQHLWDV